MYPIALQALTMISREAFSGAARCSLAPLIAGDSCSAVSRRHRASAIRKDSNFHKFGTVDNVSSVIEKLEEDLVVSSYTAPETKRMVPVFVGIMIKAIYY